MNGSIRQFENAIDLLAEGFLTKGDQEECLNAIIAALDRRRRYWEEELRVALDAGGGLKKDLTAE